MGTAVTLVGHEQESAQPIKCPKRHASMMWRRQRFRQCGTLLRHSAFDTLPQRGVDMFAIVERRAVASDASVASVQGRRMPVARGRQLPLVVLGIGRMSLSDRAQAHAPEVLLVRISE